jgi:arylsulfatase A-like enzyme
MFSRPGRRRRTAWLVAVAGACVCGGAYAGEPPSVVFLLLDTTRADRLGAWGNPRPTSPHLDALAVRGVRFARHYANAHATRPSMPQVMSGRYYHRFILRNLRAADDPRSYPFSRPDPTAALLPSILGGHGYRRVGVSAHVQVAQPSVLADTFDELTMIPVAAHLGHADADVVVDRALEAWRGRDRSRPLLLYLHFMDAHLPRYVGENGPRFTVPGYDWRDRFRKSSDPRFAAEAIEWDKGDGRDFTPADRAWFAAVYDDRLAFMDEHIGRLLAAVSADDPSLARTLVVVTADHGEQLGEEGRTEHLDTLADGVQHVPFIVAGAGVVPGQVAERPTEHVDVVPTVLGVLGLDLPPGVRVDGRAQIGPDGRACDACAKQEVFYVTEDYRAVRRGRYVLREDRPGSFRARCAGPLELWRFGGPDGRAAHTAPSIAARLHGRVARRLDALGAAFGRSRWETPKEAFLAKAQYWDVAADATVACMTVDHRMLASALDRDGWVWTGRGVTVRRPGPLAPIRFGVTAPDGEYRVAAAVVPVPPMPRLFGFPDWRKASFLTEDAKEHVPLGTRTAAAGRIEVEVPREVGERYHVLGVRLTPSGVPDAEEAPVDPALRERLRALGYVQ